MYHDTYSSTIGRRGCAPQLALLLALCLPLGCGAKKITTEGATQSRGDSLHLRHFTHEGMHTLLETEEELLALSPLLLPHATRGDSTPLPPALPLLYHHRLRVHAAGDQSSLHTDSLVRYEVERAHTQRETQRTGGSGSFFARAKAFVWGIVFTALALGGFVGYSYWRRRR